MCEDDKPTKNWSSKLAQLVAICDDHLTKPSYSQPKPKNGLVNQTRTLVRVKKGASKCSHLES